MMICASSHTLMKIRFLENKQTKIQKHVLGFYILGISGHFNECPHRHNTNVRTDNPPKLSKALGDSRRVLHLNSLNILVVKTIYTLRTDVRREELSREYFISERCSNILVAATYKPFEEASKRQRHDKSSDSVYLSQETV